MEQLLTFKLGFLNKTVDVQAVSTANPSHFMQIMSELEEEMGSLLISNPRASLEEDIKGSNKMSICLFQFSFLTSAPLTG